MVYISLGLALFGMAVFSIIRVKKIQSLCISDFVFIGLVLYFIGAASYYFSDTSYQAILVLFLSGVTLSSYVLGLVVFQYVSSGMPNYRANIFAASSFNNLITNLVYWGLLAFCLAFFALAYFRLHGNVHSLMNIRKAIATGKYGYFAPGVIKQIRDIVAPIYFCYLALANEWKKAKNIALFLVVLGAIFLSGQRMPILILLGSIGVALMLRSRSSNKQFFTKKRVLQFIVIVIIGLLGVACLNFLLGGGYREHGFFSGILQVISGAFQRIIMVVPSENIKAIPFLVHLKSSYYPGQQWANAISRVVPLHTHGLQLTNRVAYYLHYSRAANSVLGMPVNLYFNFGEIGVVIFPALFAFSLLLMESYICKLNNTFVLCSVIVLCFYSLTWYTPYLFLLNGGLILIGIMLLGLLSQHFRVDFGKANNKWA